MKANTKYTALEILESAGFKDAKDKIGKFRVSIAGISGIVSPDYIINIQPETKEIEVVLGQDVKMLKFKGIEKESIVSEKASESLKVNGEMATYESDKLDLIKNEAKKEAKREVDGISNKELMKLAKELNVKYIDIPSVLASKVYIALYQKKVLEKKDLFK